MKALPFRFDAAEHEYTAVGTGEVLPHITQMLLRCGWIDEAWYTDDATERGRAVHALTGIADLQGDIDLSTLDPRFRPYVRGYLEAMRSLPHTWTAVEVPLVHPHYRFGGRPDRVGRVIQLRTVLEVKSGVKTRAHQVQTALQAILVAGQDALTQPDAWQRLALYLKPTGKYALERHDDRRDLDEARRIIRVCCSPQMEGRIA